MKLHDIPESGRRMTEHERALQKIADHETQQVLGQPHRRGDAGQMAGSEIGRFLLRNTNADRRHDIYSACESYACLWARTGMAKGWPVPAKMAWDVRDPSGETDDRQIAQWMQRLRELETAMKTCGITAFLSAKDLILFDMPVHPTMDAAVMRALHKLAVNATRLDGGKK